MKRKRISTYIIVLLTLSSLLGAPVPAIAQQKGDTQKEELPEQPFYQGMTVGMDIFGILGKAFGSDFTSADVSLEANIKNRYFPIVEMGYGSTDTVDDETDIHYKTSAPYFRIGAGYNIFHKKPYLPGKLLAGARLGFSSFNSILQKVSKSWAKMSHGVMKLTKPFTIGFNGARNVHLANTR